MDFLVLCGEGGEEKKEEGSNSNTSNGKQNEGNGGRTNKVAVSMAVFGLVSSLFFVMF